MRDLRRFASHFRPYRLSLLAGTLCTLVAFSVHQVIPVIVGLAVDDLASGVTSRKVAGYALAVLGVSCVSSFFWFFQVRILLGISRHVEYDIRQSLYAHLQRMPLSFFHANKIGDLMARMTNDLAAVRLLAGNGLMSALVTALAFLVILPLMFRLNASLTGFIFLTLTVASLVLRYVGRRVHRLFADNQHLFGQMMARAQENLTGVGVVRAYAQEEAEAAAFNRLSRRYAEHSLKLVRTSGLLRPSINFLGGLCLVIILWYGGTLTARGRITAGEFIQFNLYLMRLLWPLVNMGSIANLYQRGTASLKRIENLFAVEPAIADLPGARRQPPVRGRVEFRHLTVTHEGRAEPALSDINLCVEAGQCVAFVGRVGSGKSTLMNLIPRLAEAPPGTVLIDGVCVRDYPLGQLRASIGYVQQESFLFGESLAANIAFGSEQAGREEVEWAAEVAGLTEDVRGFPDGLDTPVGERGVTLSGGQRQRVSIARAVLRRPRILILDDAFSAVDAYTEEAILARLRVVMRGRTSLIVSHRVSAVRDADLICVLDAGRIVERGTHGELLAAGGAYRELYRRQLLETSLSG
ncbi:MAG TPA: ABC transporter ATP-binding protein [Pyrinomonadaceae bacterium]|jgi:ATP-binding cassette subfamily B protein